MLNLIAKKLDELPPAKLFEPEYFESKYTQNDDVLEIKNINGVYEVKSRWLEKLIDSVNFEDYDSMCYFQNSINKYGLTDELKKAGAKEGDTVRVNEIEFDFVD